VTPFTMLKNAKAYCSKSKSSSTDDIRIIWNPSKIGTELYIDGIFISQSLLAAGLQQLENQIFITTQKLLYDLPMLQYLQRAQKILTQDAIANQFSFDSILDFPDMKQFSTDFIRNISQSQKFQEDLMNHGILSIVSMKKYLVRSSKLSQLLLTMLHLTSGLPSRATELQTLIIRKNGLLFNNIWILNGRLVTITYYNKTETNADDGRPIARVLPEKFSSTLLIYLACIRKIER
jgi:hypothetical protein